MNFSLVCLSGSLQQVQPGLASVNWGTSPDATIS